MTISTEVRKAGPFEGNDSAATFPFSFKVFKAADLLVVRRNEMIGVDQTLALTTDYTAALNADQNSTPGGTITLTAGALALNFSLVISSDLPLLQETDLTNQGGFYPKVITNALDRLTIFCQQLAEGAGRALTLPITSPSGVSTELPFPTPNNIIGWNSDALALQNYSPQDIATVVTYGDAISDLFTGDGSAVDFTLSHFPGSINNMDVSVGGATKRPGVDYLWDFNTKVTFTVAPPAPAVSGDKNILVRYAVAVPQGDASFKQELAQPDGASLVGVATYAQIRGYAGAGTRLNCAGRGNIFDGANGVFARDTSDTSTPDDDGYCLVDVLGRRWKRIGFPSIDPAWYGAVRDYNSATKTGTSSSQAFFKAVSLAAAGVDPSWQDGKTFNEVCKLVRPRTGNYKFTTSVPIPSGVIVDLNQSLIGGDGFTDADCEAFVTGYLDTDGVLKSNLALGDEVGRVIGAQLINWRAKNLKKFFNAKNFNEGSVCENGYASDVQQVIKGKRCFYGAFRSCVSRGAAGGTLLPAFDFDQFVNIMDLDGLVATSRQNLQRISGGANALHVRNQAYESGGTGFIVNGEVRPALFSCNYFEGLTVKGLDMSDPSTKQSVVVDNNWFYSTPVGIDGAGLLGGKIGCGNYFLNCGIHVFVNDAVSTVTVEIPPSRVPSNVSLRPIFPIDKYVLGQAIDVKYRVHNYSSTTGDTLAAQNYAGDRPMDLPYSGRQGYVPGKVAFCDTVKTAGNSFSVIVDTKINFDKYVSYIFTLEIGDNSGVALISGRGVGTDVYLDKAAGRTVTASNEGGYLRLVIPGFAHPTGVYSCEGVVRHV